MSSEISPNEQSGFGATRQVDFDLGLLISTIKKSLIWMVLIFALAMGGAYVYLHFTQPIYESSSVVQIVTDNKANRLLNVENIYESQDISKQIELLRSEEFFKRVLNSLNLEVSYYNEGEVLTHELLSILLRLKTLMLL